jgi:hypothetical protein
MKLPFDGDKRCTRTPWCVAAHSHAGQCVRMRDVPGLLLRFAVWAVKKRLA